MRSDGQHATSDLPASLERNQELHIRDFRAFTTVFSQVSHQENAFPKSGSSRGIVLFPWHARLYDRDVTPPAPESKPDSSGSPGSKEVKGKTHTYYQVLIDTRDCPHISQRSQTEAVTFLANHDDSRALYAIPGLDYVSHEDILPYNSSDQIPIQHELFERFLQYSPSKDSSSCPETPPFTARDTLRAWQEKNHPWLELSDVHRETTENIRVTVIPFYMGMRVTLPYPPSSDKTAGLRALSLRCMLTVQKHGCWVTSSVLE
ncbi:UNVERIFIED_CONTAM: hypothetical protein FKN15_031869 [Acipenser sinensis]